MTSSSGPPSRPPPGYIPPPSGLRQPNPSTLAGSLQNLQIGQPPPQPGSIPVGPGSFPAQGPVSRFGPPGRPSGPPTPFGGPVAAPRAAAVGNGPSPAPIPGQRFPPVRGPAPSQSQAQIGRPFPGSPPLSSQTPQPVVSQPISRPGPQQIPGIPPFAGYPGRPSQQPPPAIPPAAYPITSQPPPQSFPGLPPAAIPPTGYSAPPQPSLQSFSGPPPPPSFTGVARSQPFSAPGPSQVYSRPPGSSSPYQVPPSMPGAMQAPPRMYGMPSHAQSPVFPTSVGQSPITAAQGSSPSQIDPNQIPRPVPTSSETLFETRLGNQANLPPPASSEYVVRDSGNCSPRLMRCTINQIPCTSDLISTSSMPLALLVQPLALPHPSEEPIQVVDFGESGPIRCSRCKGYINPFMKFIDQGKRFVCNLCGFTDETPRDYYCNLGPDGRRRDAEERPELCRGAVEFVATKEYMVRDPMPPVFFFLIDVSMNAIQTGATAAACSAIGQAIADLPEGPRTMVGLATFDSTIHFYSLKRGSQQPLMLIVPDIQDVYTPLHSDIIVRLTECRQHLGQLLESIPSMFENNRIVESAFGAATKAAFLALKPTGGKLLVFQSVLPSAGLGSLSAREAEGRANVSSASDKEAHKLLQPIDKSYKTMALEFAEQQVCVDAFITAQSYVDIASISVISATTGGQVYYYYPFSAISDSSKLYNDLRWNVTRPQGFEAVMRIRCGQGLQVQEYHGNFCKRIPTDIDLPAIDCDKTIMVTFKHDDKFQEGTECAFQCALLYTTMYGERRIRVTNLSLPCTSMLSNLFRSADLDAQFTCMLKQAAMAIPINSLSQVREQMTNFCINILYSYRKFCATASLSGQLILPEALKLLPLYTLALTKSIGVRSDGRLDERSYWVNHVGSISVPLAAPFVYPRLFAVHSLGMKDDDRSLIPPTLPLSSEHITDDGVFLLENGEDALIYVGNSVKTEILEQIFGSSSAGVSTQFVLQQLDNELSKRLNDVVNEIRRQRCSFLRLRLCRKGDPSGMLFFSYMVEDKNPAGLSYVEFLVHVHRQIQTKMA